MAENKPGLVFASKYIAYNEGESWATVTLPIGDFGWEQFGADETNIKQMIIQFEAAGDVYFDEIRVVPFYRNFKQALRITF